MTTPLTSTGQENQDIHDIAQDKTTHDIQEMAKDKDPSFIEKRLDSLYEIDCKIVSLLDKVSNIFETYTAQPAASHESSQGTKDKFVGQTRDVYGILSKIAIDLRKEVKIMDDNVGVYDKNEDNVMILPLAVDQKNTRLGEKRLRAELKQLDKLVPLKGTSSDAVQDTDALQTSDKPEAQDVTTTEIKVENDEGKHEQKDIKDEDIEMND